MSTAAERLINGDHVASVPTVETLPQCAVSPEWHSLRLFGLGRHMGAFHAGAETRNEL
jgi:hypothetical protein